MSTPYDPLDLRTLAESMVKVVLEQRVYPLGEIPSFEGAGVYVIYYTGNYDPYKSIAQKNKGNKWNQPIYVGEAARKGGRKGGAALCRKEGSRRVAGEPAAIRERSRGYHQPFLEGRHQRSLRRREKSNYPCRRF